MPDSPEDSPPGEPHDGASSAAGRGLAPLVWLLAAGWVALQGLGQAGLWLLTAVDEGTSAAARVGARTFRAVAGALGPLGRGLRRLVTPAARWLRRGWDRLGRRVLLAMFRPLGRFGRWLVTRSRPAVARVLACARALAVRLLPALDALTAAVEAVERAAGRLGSLLTRAWAPVSRRLRAVRAGRGGPGR
jgi:hypothetical protein